jgi:catechol 2,3-dioxygenase-like lactoylglutathione lyase family enzyme
LHPKPLSLHVAKEIPLFFIEVIMATIAGVLETSLYVSDLERSTTFYQEIMKFRRLVMDQRFCALSVSDRQVLLLFKRGASVQAMAIPGGVIPPHDGHGELHIAFAIDLEEFADWEQHLDQRGVFIESRVEWERGGRSLYFRDPDRHLVELVTPGCWEIY